MTRIRGLALAFGLLSTVAGAQEPDWSRAQRVDVELSSFDFTPSTLHLKAGRPVILHLVNTASGGHDFAAPAFFAAAQLRPRDRPALAKGRVEVRGGQSRDVALVPRAGRYPLKCSHAFHKTFGMTGRILVD